MLPKGKILVSHSLSINFVFLLYVWMFPLHGCLCTICVQCLCTTCVQCLWMLEGGVRPTNFNLYEMSISWESRLPWTGHKINQPAGPLEKTTPRTDHVDFRIPGYFQGDRVEEAACIQAGMPLLPSYAILPWLFFSFRKCSFIFLSSSFSFSSFFSLARFGHTENRA